MNVRDTSLSAYYGKVLPHLGKRQKEVLVVFEENRHVNWTNMELAQALQWSINRVTPRVKELRDEGLLTTACRRECLVTGNQAYAWKLC